MTGHRHDLGDTPKVVSVPARVASAARRAVLWRVECGELTREDARVVLDQLGLLPGQQSPRVRRP